MDNLVFLEWHLFGFLFYHMEWHMEWLTNRNVEKKINQQKNLENECIPNTKQRVLIWEQSRLG